jgi:hypothetical protein
MRTLLAALALAAASLAALLAPAPVPSGPPSASERCVISEPIYYQDTELVGQKKVCVPWPLDGA